MKVLTCYFLWDKGYHHHQLYQYHLPYPTKEVKYEVRQSFINLTVYHLYIYMCVSSICQSTSLTLYPNPSIGQLSSICQLTCLTLYPNPSIGQLSSI